MNKTELLHSIVYIVEREVQDRLPTMVKKELIKNIKPLLKEIAKLKIENKKLNESLLSVEKVIVANVDRSNMIIGPPAFGVANAQVSNETAVHTATLAENESPEQYTNRMISEQRSGISSQQAPYPNMGGGAYTADRVHTVANGNGNMVNLNSGDRTPALGTDNRPITAPIPEEISKNINKNYSDLMTKMDNLHG